MHKALATSLLAALLVATMIVPLRADDDIEEDLEEAKEAAASAPVEPSCFGDAIRISALILSGGGVKVGIVETATKASYLVRPGEKAGNVEVVSADYDKETVVLQMGDAVCTLHLASDPNAEPIDITAVNPATGIFRGEAIEQFLRDNPAAIDEGVIKFPLPMMPPAQGRGEGIEAFLRNNPALAAELDKPVVGKGEGIEKFLKENPELNTPDEVVIDGFGPGIEEQMRLHPELFTNNIPGFEVPPEAQPAPDAP